jgi:acyl-CoA synthetase (AMP-forming)/AMP-acid ligase II
MTEPTMTELTTTGTANTGAAPRTGTAVVDRAGRVLTFAALDERVAATRAGLAAAGMRPGDSVFFAVRPGVESLTLGLAILELGATIVVADPGAGDELFAARAALVREGGGQVWAAAESLLYALTARTSLRTLVQRRGRNLPDVSRVGASRYIRTGRWLPGVPRGALPLERLRQLGRFRPEAAPALDPDLRALIVFTSGTTAAPRAVVHTHATLDASRRLMNGRIGWGPGDVVHTGQLMIALPALAAGATWSLPGKGERPVTHLFGTPADVAALLDAGPLPGAAPGTLRCVLLGAAPVPPAILRRLSAEAPEAEVLSVYGTTEALPIAVASAEDGEIHVRSPHVAGYLERSADELATGDIGRLDPDGSLFLLGRKKDMLIRGSFNLYPGLYEPAIAARPGVADCAYVGVPDRETADEQVVLAVVPAEGEDPGQLAKRLARELPTVIDVAACPDRIVPVEAIPRRGRTDKPDRAALRDLVAAG